MFSYLGLVNARWFPFHFHLFVPGIVFSCASFVVSTGWKRCTWNAQQSPTPSKIAMNIATQELVCFQGTESRSCYGSNVRCLQWHAVQMEPFPDCAFSSDFLATNMWCFQFRRETQVEATRAELRRCTLHLKRSQSNTELSKQDIRI